MEVEYEVVCDLSNDTIFTDADQHFPNKHSSRNDLKFYFGSTQNSLRKIVKIFHRCTHKFQLYLKKSQIDF